MSQEIMKFPPEAPSWRSFRRQHQFEHYYRIALMVVLVNLVIGWQTTNWTTQWLTHAIFANLAITILIRQQYVINALFKLATMSKTRLPLAIRWRLGKVYHFGGIHVGTALCASVWFAIFTGAQTIAFLEGQPNSLTLALSWLALVLLTGILLTAMPQFRHRFHNTFERCHRFGGWALLAVFIAMETMAQLASQTPWYTSATAWLLIAVCLSILLPWLRLKRVAVTVSKHSSHAVIAEFDYGMTPFPGSAMAISHKPLLEWHAFATIPTPNQSGYRLAISRAGDWTGNFIDNPPSHVWVKGIATAGVANIEVLFNRVLYIATGSGIGPVLPHLLAKQVPMHLVWTTKAPRATYGDQLVEEILTAEPSANVINTDEYGKPDMVELALKESLQFGAEAVIVISNKKLTRRMVTALEKRGIPAFGAIFDS